MSVTGSNDTGATDPQVIPYLLYADAGAANEHGHRTTGGTGCRNDADPSHLRIRDPKLGSVLRRAAELLS